MGWSKLSRHQRGYGAVWTQLRKLILARDYYLCQPCLTTGRATEAVAVDHIIPKAQGGDDDPANLQSICAPCHDAKTAREAAEARGATYKPRLAFTPDGQPIWPDRP